MRPTSPARGYTWAYRRMRAVVAAQAPPACIVCGALFPLELDHVVPLRRGGTNEIENLEWRCVRHHHEKTSRESPRPKKSNFT